MTKQELNLINSNTCEQSPRSSATDLVYKKLQGQATSQASSSCFKLQIFYIHTGRNTYHARII